MRDQEYHSGSARLGPILVSTFDAYLQRPLVFVALQTEINEATGVGLLPSALNMRLWILRLWSLAITALAQNTSTYEADLITTLSQYSQLTTFTSILAQYPKVWNRTAAGNLTSE